MDPVVAFRALMEADLKSRAVAMTDPQALDKFFNHQVVPHLDTTQIIAAAKAACSVIHVLDTSVCPFINQLPG